MKTKSKHILIIEDDELNMKLFRDLLEVNGYHPLCSSNGEDGMLMAKKHHPDLILMDIQLPEMSGIDLIRAIKSDKTLSSIPIIAVTAFAMKGDERHILEAGCDAYLSKPIQISKFMDLVHTFLKQPTQ